MLRDINRQDPHEVTQLLDVQKREYLVEADIIGFYDIPPLRDTTDTLQACPETFVGYFEDETLCGAIAYEREADTVDICRLIVDPHHFRKGIASRLVAHVLDAERSASRFTVSTGAKNTPAIALYAKKGFSVTGERLIAEGVCLTQLERKND